MLETDSTAGQQPDKAHGRVFPSFDFFVSDWLAASFRYDSAEPEIEGFATLELAVHAWRHGGYLPADPVALRRMVNADLARWTHVFEPALARCCEPTGEGRLAFLRPFNLPAQYDKATARSSEQAARGRRSAEVRIGKFGTAQPSKRSNRGSK